MLCAPCGVGVRCDLHGTPSDPQPMVDAQSLADWHAVVGATNAGVTHAHVTGQVTCWISGCAGAAPNARGGAS